MSQIEASRLRKLLATTIGPAPWYWETFPSFRSPSGQKFVWTHHGTEGPVAHLVTLGLEQEPERIRLALNTYCRPFVVSPNALGIWCPEGRSIRLACFDPEQLKAFDFRSIIDNTLVDRLVREGYFEKLFGAGIKEEEERKSKQAFR